MLFCVIYLSACSRTAIPVQTERIVSSNDASLDAKAVKEALSACEQDLSGKGVGLADRREICLEKYSVYGEYARSCLAHYIISIKSIQNKIDFGYLRNNVSPSCVLRMRPPNLPLKVKAFHELTAAERAGFKPYEWQTDFVDYVINTPKK